MAHEKVYGFCENKCKVEVPPKSVIDGILDAFTIAEDGSITVNGNVINTKEVTNNDNLVNKGTITSTGLITAKGGVKGIHHVPAVVGTSGDVNYATLAAQTLNITETKEANAQSITCQNYVRSYTTPVKHCIGVYTCESDLSGSPMNPSVSKRTMTVNWILPKGLKGNPTQYLFYKKSTDSSYTRLYKSLTFSEELTADYTYTFLTIDIAIGETYQFYRNYTTGTIQVNIPAGTTYKVKYATP